MIDFHPVGAVVGYTHASSVIAAVRPSDAEFATVTCAPLPLNTSALPNLPDVVQVAPLMVPLFPLPERSVTLVPAPSLKLYAATSPVCADADSGSASAARTTEDNTAHR